MKNLFPIFSHHPDLVFLDSAASAQKPQVVLDAVRKFYEMSYANIHRGLYGLSLEATQEFDAAREKIAAFFGVESKEIIFTKNGTEAINLFANSWGKTFLQKGDEIVLTIAEHHANFLPWLKLREELGIVLKFIEPKDENMIFTAADFAENISEKTKLIAFPHVSNVTGQIFPVAEIVNLAEKFGALTFLDACQSAAHFPVNFQELGVAAACFTGHKMGAPGATGGIYVRSELLAKMPPFLVGGDMVESVTREGFTALAAPQRFEAGTPAIVEIVGLGVACDFLAEHDRTKIRAHEIKLLEYALREIAEKLLNFRLIGPEKAAERSSVIALSHQKIHPHDLAQFLDTKQICVRSGFHCAEPLHRHLGLEFGSLRLSLWLYNEKEDIDAFLTALQAGEKLFS